MTNDLTYSLIIDTSGKSALIILCEKEKALDYFNLPIEKDLSKILFPSIIKLLKANNLEVSDLQYIAVGTGPGSYTGIRVGVAAAKSLSYGLSIPLIGFCSLKAYLPENDGVFNILLDAKSGGMYILEGAKRKNDNDTDTVIYEHKPKIISTTDFLKNINNRATYCSPDCTSINKKVKEETFLCKKTVFAPDHLATICFFKYSNKSFNLSDKLKLLYLRGPKPIAL